MGSLFECKTHLSQHKIGLEHIGLDSEPSHHSENLNWIFHHFTGNIGLRMSKMSLYNDNHDNEIGQALACQLNWPKTTL